MGTGGLATQAGGVALGAKQAKGIALGVKRAKGRANRIRAIRARVCAWGAGGVRVRAA